MIIDQGGELKLMLHLILARFWTLEWMQLHTVDADDDCSDDNKQSSNCGLSWSPTSDNTPLRANISHLLIVRPTNCRTHCPKCTSLYCTIVSIPITYVRYRCGISRQRFSLADCPMATYGWFVCSHFHPKHNNKICDDSFHPRLNNVLFPNCKCWRSCPWFHLVSLDFTNWSVSGMLAQAARIVRICWVLSPRFPQSGCTQTHEWRLCTEKCQSVRCSEEGGEDHQSADLPTDIYGRWWWCRLPTTPMLKPNCWLKIPKFELDLK